MKTLTELKEAVIEAARNQAKLDFYYDGLAATEEACDDLEAAVCALDRAERAAKGAE